MNCSNCNEPPTPLFHTHTNTDSSVGEQFPKCSCPCVGVGMSCSVHSCLGCRLRANTGEAVIYSVRWRWQLSRRSCLQPWHISESGMACSLFEVALILLESFQLAAHKKDDWIVWNILLVVKIFNVQLFSRDLSHTAIFSHFVSKTNFCFFSVNFKECKSLLCGWTLMSLEY